MKLAYLLLGLFLIIISVRTNARDLKPTEKAVILLNQRAIEVQEHFVDSVDEDALNFAEFMLYQASKRGCVPFQTLVKKIGGEAEDFPDQSAKLMSLYQVCSESALTITHFYTKQN